MSLTFGNFKDFNGEIVGLEEGKRGILKKGCERKKKQLIDFSMFCVIIYVENIPLFSAKVPLCNFGTLIYMLVLKYVICYKIMMGSCSIVYFVYF